MVTWRVRTTGSFHELPDWDPAKPGVLSRYDEGEFVPFPAEADVMPIPELLAYYVLGYGPNLARHLEGNAP